ncbi:MAG: TetR/AcrR family transcriptional regulator C-terminal domain-containing protein [Peptococcaceae bacterium]|nr:TetR/AcrR family transcriptional regulator C-terminal domain-containing protein [Peptococcaceae bacterium]
MADSNITKQALAEALKSLMAQQPFDKINVGQICEKCNMNRKSFYYHFKDKYDLVNWIFDVEFIALLQKVEQQNDELQNHWDLFEEFCADFYRDRIFYRAALQIKGQNSFSDHFREVLRPLLRTRLYTLIGQHVVGEMQEQYLDFCVDTFTDAFLCGMERWIGEKDCMPPDKFVTMLRAIISGTAMTLVQELQNEENNTFCT